MRLERLEDRVLLTAGDSLANAIPLSFSDNPGATVQTATATEYLASPNDIELNQISLTAGDTVTAAVNTAPYGGGLNSYLRVFQAVTTPPGSDSPPVQQIASNDNYHGQDPQVTFQASVSGTYYIGISSFDNTTYNPAVPESGTGTSSGLFDLTLTETSTPATLAPLLVGASFQVSQTTAVAGDQITVTYSVENRGGTASSATSLALVSATDNSFQVQDNLTSLQTGTLPALNPGQSYQGSFSNVPLTGFPSSAQQTFLGLQIGTAAPSSPEQGNDWAPVQLLQAQIAPVSGSSSTLGTAAPIALNSQTDAITLPAGGEDFFQLSVTQAGNLTAQISGASGPTSLGLYNAQGIPIVQSDGQSASNLNPLLTQGLTDSDSSGTTYYYLKLANLGTTSASYSLTTQFTPSVSTLQVTPVQNGPYGLAEGDFNGDGRLDLALLTNGGDTVTVMLGNGDGTFQLGQTLSLRQPAQALVAGDFSGDGRLDLIAATPYSQGIMVMLGNGDGTFQPAKPLKMVGGTALAVGDFTGDGDLDLAIANHRAGTVTVLLGNGNGTFQTNNLLTVNVPGGPIALVAGDFTGDGILDLATADEYTNQVTVLLGNGTGAFPTVENYSVSNGPGTGQAPVGIVAADFTGNGRLDLATVNKFSGDVSVLLNQGNGTFATTPEIYTVGNAPTALVTGDFTGDGHVDLAVADGYASAVTVLLGQGNGTFVPAQPTPVVAPIMLVAGDFSGDGRVDLATTGYAAKSVTVLLGNGDGTFTSVPTPNATGLEADAMVTGDFTGDGHLDLAIANSYAGTVTILLGQGDGTFQSAGTVAAGADPHALVAGDFNGDGRLDLAVADYGTSYGASKGPPGITLLMGNGNGTFQQGGFISLGKSRPSALVAGDFNGDGILDLAVAIEAYYDYTPASEVAVLMGNGDGTFQAPQYFNVGTQPDALVAGDFSGDGRLDLAVADYGSQDVRVLQNVPVNGSPDNQQVNFVPLGFPVTLQGTPVALVAGDFNGDGSPDLAVATKYSDSVEVLLNNGNGTFAAPVVYPLAVTVSGLAAGDFTGDGVLDLALTNTVYLGTYEPASSVTLLMGDGHGGFQNNGTVPVGAAPTALVVGDFNGDGNQDIAVANGEEENVSVLLGTGTGAFVSPEQAPEPEQSTPLVADLIGSVPDAVVLTQTGQILFRQGLANEPGAFAPPVVLNPDPQDAARDLTVVQTANGQSFLAALDANTSAVTLYLPLADGTFTMVAGPDLPAGVLPANIASADLTGNDRGDLVITAAGSDQVFVALQTPSGGFETPTPYSVGVNPLAIAFVDDNGDNLPDIVVTDRFSGQVSVLLNQGGGVFLSTAEQFDAGSGPYDLTPVSSGEGVQSLEGTNGVVAGSFAGSPGPDLVVSNGTAGTISLLAGNGLGGFLNPQAGLTFSVGSQPTAIVAGQFIVGDPNLDLAVLSAESDTISIYKGNGHGGFTLISTVSAGNDPTGLAVADVTRPGGGGPDGIEDLLVGNTYGDLLILAGNGNGTFSQYVRADQTVSLAVAGGATAGSNTFYFSDQATDQLAYQSAAAGASSVANPAVYQNRSAGILAPGPETVVTVAGVQYLVVVNSGANELLIYTLDSNGQPEPASKQTYFTGTDPVSLTVTNASNDLNSDGIPDVVTANEGSNDVSVFVGQLTADGWSLAYRPRQSSGGIGPTSVVVADVTNADGSAGSDGIPDLLVSNSESNDVGVLVGRGNGYFVNQSPTSPGPGGEVPLLTGDDPQELFVGNYEGTSELDLVTINTASSTVTLIADFLSAAPTTTTISSGGTFPVAAVSGHFNGSAAPDLLVANSGDGTLTLLLGGPGGFELGGTVFDPAAPHLSDLALVAAGNALDVYGTNAGREAAVLLETFNFATQATPTFFPSSPGFPNGVEIAFGNSDNLESIPAQSGIGGIGGVPLGNLGTMPPLAQQQVAAAAGPQNGGLGPPSRQNAQFNDTDETEAVSTGQVNAGAAPPPGVGADMVVQDSGTGGGGQGTGSPGGNGGSGILLHNLTDPDNDDAPLRLDAYERAVDALFEMAQADEVPPRSATEPIGPIGPIGPICLQGLDAERPELRSHAERGNEEVSAPPEWGWKDTLGVAVALTALWQGHAAAVRAGSGSDDHHRRSRFRL